MLLKYNFIYLRSVNIVAYWGYIKSQKRSWLLWTLLYELSKINGFVESKVSEKDVCFNISNFLLI